MHVKWLPMGSCPLGVPVIVWRKRVAGPCVAVVQRSIFTEGFDAVEPESGRMFGVDCWMPLETFPKPPVQS